MRIRMLRTEMWLPQPVEEVFAFFSDARNLERITPPWLRFEVVRTDPGPMRPGLKIDYQLRIRGIPVRWQSEITVWEPPTRFVDVQRRGPYHLWEHEHLFRTEDGGTVCEDKVRYAVLGGPLVERLLIAPELRRIFAFRRVALHSLFGPDPR